MIRPGSLAWFAAHELRVAWRDWAWLLSGGRRRRGLIVAFVLVGFFVLMHGVMFLALPRTESILAAPDKATLVVIGSTLALYLSLMLSQAMEAVTRAFYTRGDLDLVLSSPAAAQRLFAVRLGAMAVTISGMALVLAAPAIDVLALLGGTHWLAAYGVTVSLAMLSVAISAATTVALFATIGPKQTRFVAQVIAAVVGAGFVIGVQFLAILSIGTMSRMEFFSSEAILDRIPDPESLIWLPAKAAAGNWAGLGILLVVGIGSLTTAIRLCAPHFGALALATAGIARSATARRRRSAFRPGSPAQTLRHKEWALLRRDPWLISQSLMQLLYLLPPFFMLWHSFYGGIDSATILVPVLIMASGQLAGGLAWLAVSGEDAPDLVGSAPITPARIWRAKVEAVGGVIALVFAPAILILAFVELGAALVASAGIAAAAASASLIQFWFRTQAKRSMFRRRQISSRIATFAEAFSSVTWSAAGAVAVVNPWLAVLPGAAAVAVLAGAWLISPQRG